MPRIVLIVRPISCPQPAPQRLKRDEPSWEPRLGADNHKRSLIRFKGLFGRPPCWITALIAFFAGWYIQRNQLLLSTQVNSNQLQAKDQMIQNQEAQLAQARQQLNENSNQLTEMKTKLEESQKELSAMQRRLGVATREVDRLNASRSVAVRRTASRSPETAASFPAPVPGGRRTAEPGVYGQPGRRRYMKIRHPLRALSRKSAEEPGSTS